MMMSLIPGDLGVQTEWFWLLSSPLTSLLYSEGSVLESGRIQKWGAPGCKTSPVEICLIIIFFKKMTFPWSWLSAEKKKPHKLWVKIIHGLLTIYSEVIPGENNHNLYFYCPAQGLPQCRNSQMWAQRMNLFSLIWEARWGDAYNEGQRALS